MKKWISLFLAALLVVGMAACSAPAAAPDAQAGQAQADQPEASDEEMVVVEAYIVQPDISFIADRVACTCTLPLADMAAMCCASVSLLP